MTTATATPTAPTRDVHKDLAEHLRRKKEAAESAYSIHGGRDIQRCHSAPDQIDPVLSAAGESPEKLQDDVKLLAQRTAWANDVKQLPEAIDALAAVEREIEQELTDHEQRLQRIDQRRTDASDELERLEKSRLQLRKTQPPQLKSSRSRIDSRRKKCRRHAAMPLPTPTLAEREHLIGWRNGADAVP